MATGKERGFDKWNMSKAVKRSARNYTESDTINRASSKSKNTKKWCKGKRGRKHTLVMYNKYSGLFYRKCVKCGKELYGPLKSEDYDFIPGTWETVYGGK